MGAKYDIIGLNYAETSQARRPHRGGDTGSYRAGKDSFECRRGDRLL